MESERRSGFDEYRIRVKSLNSPVFLRCLRAMGGGISEQKFGREQDAKKPDISRISEPCPIKNEKKYTTKSALPEPFKPALALPSQGRTPFYAKSMILEKTRRKMGEKRRVPETNRFNGRRWKDVREKAGKALWGKGIGRV